VLDVETYARKSSGERLALRVLGLDALRAAPLAPDLVPRPAAGEGRFAMLDPGLVFLNASARKQLGLADGAMLSLQVGQDFVALRVAGSVAAGGAPMAVMDLAGAQTTLQNIGRITRIDVRLAAGITRWPDTLALPANVRVVSPQDGEARVSNLSRAYRVNLTVLALVALFVGAFLVFSVVSLSVAQRTQGFALLGVLGMAARERRWLVWLECAGIGVLGSTLGVALGGVMAHFALQWLAGDLGGGYFPGITPALHVDALEALGFVALGTASAVVGGWVPAQQAEALSPAQALKGLGHSGAAAPALWPGLSLILAGGALALLPPIGGLPLAAYLSVAAILFGGVALVPAAVHALLAAWPHPQHPLVLLALRRANFQRSTASAAVAGVVSSLALSVALTVMVASFRTSVSAWLDSVLPADLYARTASSSAAADQAWFDAAFVDAVAGLAGVAKVQAQRVRALSLDPAQPTVALVSRPLADPAQALPLLAPPLPLPAGEVGVFVSEAVVALYGVQPGGTMVLPLTQTQTAAPLTVRVLGVWRDFARQFGAISIDARDYQRLTGDLRLNDLAVWLQPGADAAALQQRIRGLMTHPSMIDFAASSELRQWSLRIFDRSFAVTSYLQAVAVAIGLVGIAASLSAQVLARRKEFGLLAHLGLTRGQVLAIVAAEAAAWMAAGVVLGLVLGLIVSMVLVFVVNPQSFYWSMDLVLPAARLAVLAGAVWLAGVATAAFSARAAVSRAAVLSVKEDW
jgi:putative ABC transport system permease protein